MGSEFYSIEMIILHWQENLCGAGLCMNLPFFLPALANENNQ